MDLVLKVSHSQCWWMTAVVVVSQLILLCDSPEICNIIDKRIFVTVYSVFYSRIVNWKLFALYTLHLGEMKNLVLLLFLQITLLFLKYMCSSFVSLILCSVLSWLWFSFQVLRTCLRIVTCDCSMYGSGWLRVRSWRKHRQLCRMHNRPRLHQDSALYQVRWLRACTVILGCSEN